MNWTLAALDRTMRIPRLKTAGPAVSAYVWLAVAAGFASEPRDFPAGFHFGRVRDARLPDILERVRREHDLPALATVSVTSTGVVELAAVGLRAVGFRERVTTNVLLRQACEAPITAAAARITGAAEWPRSNARG